MANRLVALFLLFILGIPMIILIIISSIDTGQIGLFTQKRVGLHGKPFTIFKIRTLKGTFESSITDSQMKKSEWGTFLRKYHIDEWPQLWNILWGDMNFVGPRPDTEEMYQLLSQKEFEVLTSIKPGLTGEQQLEHWEEENQLSKMEDPESYYKEILWPKKVQTNIAYIKKIKKPSDLRLIFRTLKKIFR